MQTKPQLRFKDSNNNLYNDIKKISVGELCNTITDFVAAGSFADLRQKVKYEKKASYAQLVRTIDIKNKFHNRDFVFVNEDAFKFLWRVNLNENSIILPNIGANIGEVYYINPKNIPYPNSVLGPNAILLKSQNNNLYYIYSYMMTDYFKRKQSLIVGASGQPKFNKTDLKEIKLFIPCIEEQEKIANFFSKVDEIIEEREAEVSDLEQKKKGLMQKLFSQQLRFTDSNNKPYPNWETNKLATTGQIVTGNTPKTEDKSNYGDDYLWCSPADLGYTKFINKTKTKLSKQGFQCTRALPCNSILVTCIGSTIGKIGIATQEMASNQQINAIILHNAFIPDFVYYALLYNFPRYMSCVNQQAVPIINKTDFGNLKILVPEIEEQEKIAKVLSKIDELIEEKKALLSDWKQFKKGLLQKMFV